MTVPPPPATLVVGAEAFLADRAVSDVLSAARAADPGTERRDLDLSAEEARGQFLEAVSPTLFGGGVVVVASGLESCDAGVLETLVAAIRAPEPDVLLVVLHPGGAKGKSAVEAVRGAGAVEVVADKLKGRAIDDFVVAEFRRHGRKVTSPGIAALRASVGDDLRALASSASQLSSDVDADPVTDVEVAAYYEGVAGASAFAISDAVWSADPTQVLVSLRWALSADPGFGPAVVATVAGSLRSLLRLAGAPAGMGDNELAREVGVPAWKLKALRAQLRRWTPRELAEAVRLLARADVAMKGGSDGVGLEPVQKRAMLERTLLDIAAREREGVTP